ncbi:hypothetical protein KR100_03170 [Synechococcus sp. KORDI-100]|uniref:hypothetical protein n=1 Tax=Synechococcus sp. KORDI-100 TaxID=1280380 RepID=UPI0004E09579|nr:hypothetical protein [Synechococcus sp. KORDI-100]AII42395.1 hypothetical protein KR100_03170 [Synechococcus sp. KORDI-100]
MRRSSIWIYVALLLTSSTLASSAHSETRQVFCHLQIKSPVIKKTQQAARCQFSQYQGNAYVILYPGNRSPLEFEFPARKQNITYQRANKEGGIKFSTSILTLKVFWADPGTNHQF